MSNNILSLDSRRGSAFKFTRSTMYQSKCTNLCTEKKFQLKRIEFKFSEARGSGGVPAQEIVAPQVAHEFKCDDGGIYYYFSGERDCVVLTDFWLTEGGGRSKLIPCTLVVVPSNCTLPRRLVAAHSALASLFRPLLNVALNVCNSFREVRSSGISFARDLDKIHWPTSLDLRYLSYTRDRDELSAMADLINVNSIMTGAQLASLGVLPDWSVLHGGLIASEQLCNAFARRIVFGEVVCWLGQRSGIGADSGCDDFYSEPMLLFDEVKDILRGIIDPSYCADASKFQFSRCATLIDDDLRSDDIVLRLLRAEIVWNVSRMLTRNTKFVSSRSLEHVVPDLTCGPPRMLRRFALLADFVSLSDSYFGLDQCVADTVGAAEARLRNAKAHCVSLEHVMRVATYEKAVSALAAQLDPEAEAPQLPTAMEKRDRLVHILSDMLTNNS